MGPEEIYGYAIEERTRIEKELEVALHDPDCARSTAYRRAFQDMAELALALGAKVRGLDPAHGLTKVELTKLRLEGYAGEVKSK